MVAMEESWDAIMAHKEVIRTAIELILRDGIEAGEFEPVDPRETSALIMQGLRRLLPSGPDRPGPAGRPRSRSRSPLARSASCCAPSPPESSAVMTSPQHASLRLKSDDFLFSSVISHHDAANAADVSAAPRIEVSRTGGVAFSRRCARRRAAARRLPGGNRAGAEVGASGAGAARRVRDRRRRRASSSASCARATRPISASASAARS